LSSRVFTENIAHWHWRLPGACPASGQCVRIVEQSTPSVEPSHCESEQNVSATLNIVVESVNALQVLVASPSKGEAAGSPTAIYWKVLPARRPGA
jgi:hypothetical protein